MDLAGLHVAAACTSLAVGVVVLARHKGGAGHVALGRVYLAALLAVNVPALLLYDATGAPGPFHVLAFVSLATTGLGWLSARHHRRASGNGIGRHAVLMTWSWIGVATAGLAQLANQLWPQSSPWPVVAVIVVATALGLTCVPRLVARALANR